ncbi:MAG: glycoside hydrolase [Kiritimatiellia bacterium]
MKTTSAWTCAAAAALVFGACAETWTFKDPHAWSRVESAATLTARGGGAFELRHTAGEDWCIHGVDAITVKPGDVFRLSCASEALADVPNAQPFALSVTLRDAQGKVLNWGYGSRSAKPGRPVVSEFMIPPGAARIEPRVVGHGPCGVVIRNFTVESLGNRLPKGDRPAATLTQENDLLAVSVSGTDAALTVTDKRTGRVWAPVAAGGRRLVAETARAGRALWVKFFEPETLATWEASVSPVPGRPEILVTVSGEGDMAGNLAYPAAFATRKGDRLIVPMNEGISFPADQPDGVPGRLVTYSGHGICMSFFGVQDDATGAGYMGIVETTDDAAVAFTRPEGGCITSPGVSWEPQKGRFGPARRIRFVFLDKGGYVAMCKRYRAYAKEQGKLKTFAEKAQERPLVDRLLGAPNVWCWTGDKVGMAKKLKEAGIDRFLWSAGGDAQQVEALAKMENVLVSRYDVYRDIYRPEQLRKLGWKKGTNTDAWPEGAAWNSADSNDWRKAWGVKAKDGTWTYCGCMCDAVSAKFCRRHVGQELRTHPYNTRFIDVTTAAGWDVCFNPAHPMTRSDSRAYRMDLLRLLGDEFGLVVGSETGHDAAVPYCDYFEGMLSLGNYRVPDSGRNISEVWTNVPPRVAKFQVGAEYRLPLWELVYHECLCAHWYWGDYNNKLPALWDRRDLFNVLYGTMGMYLFNERQWAADKDRFVRSYKLTSPVARATGYSEMLDHRILTPDRQVQQSVFANGTVVTVNFGEAPYALADGTVVAARGSHVQWKEAAAGGQTPGR